MGFKNKRQREEEAAVFVPKRPAAPHTHLNKHKKRDKALEVVFDPKAHKEYLTGFHKRKVKRRKEALKNLERMQREQRLEERAERRQAMKEELQRMGASLSDSEGEDEGREGGAAEAAAAGKDGGGGSGAAERPWVERREYDGDHRGPEWHSVVTIEPIPSGSDSDEEEEAGGSDGGSGDEMHAGEPRQQRGQQRVGAGQGRAQQGQQGQGQGQAGEEPGAQQGRKLSKTSLRIMTKTKLKVEGKRASGQSKKSTKGSGGGGKGSGGKNSGGKGGGGKRRGGGRGKGRR